MKFHPTRDEFVALARRQPVVPVWTEVLADLETPVSAFLKLVGEQPGVTYIKMRKGTSVGK